MPQHMTDLSRVGIRHVAKINAAFEDLPRVTVGAVRKIGNALIAAKKDVPRGQWLPWLAHHYPQRSYRTLAVYMRIAKSPKSAAAAHLREAIAGAVEALGSKTEGDRGEVGKTRFITAMVVDRTERIAVPYYVSSEPSPLSAWQPREPAHEPEPEPTVVDFPQSSDAGYRAMVSAWQRATPDEQRRFLKEIGATLVAACR
jgi:hypothetical protein